MKNISKVLTAAALVAIFAVGCAGSEIEGEGESEMTDRLDRIFDQKPVDTMTATFAMG